MIEVRDKIDKEWPELSEKARQHLYSIVDLAFKFSQEAFGEEPSIEKRKALISMIFSILHLTTIEDQNASSTPNT